MWSALQTTMISCGVLGNSYPHDWLIFCICVAANFSLHTGSKMGTVGFVPALKCLPFSSSKFLPVYEISPYPHTVILCTRKSRF